MASVGIRDLKNHLSRYVRRVEAGERVRVTDRGRVVAELVRPTSGAAARRWRWWPKIVATGKRRRGPATSAAVPPTYYIESSALLASFLESDVSAQRAIRARGRRMTSALTVAEAQRALLRARLAGRLTEDQERHALRGLQTFARRCELIAISDDVLARAGRPFPVEPVRTPDSTPLG